jgi:hypothetical protein
MTFGTVVTVTDGVPTVRIDGTAEADAVPVLTARSYAPAVGDRVALDRIGLRYVAVYAIGPYSPKMPTTAVVKLTAAGWSSLSQTAAVNGLPEGAFVLWEPAPASHAAAAAAGVYCSAQAAGSLTFACSAAPAADITVNVLFKEGGS